MSQWNHNVCWACWRSRNKKDNSIKVPIRLVEGEELPILDLEDACCFCNHINIEGIYMREDPEKMPCHGIHKEDFE